MADRQDVRYRADHHGDFADGVVRLARELMQAFRVLNRINYAQPWETPLKRPQRCR